MASEQILEQLFLACQASSAFAGKSDDEIRKACLKHKDKTDEYIQLTIKNIKRFDDDKERKELGVKGEGLDTGIDEIHQNTINSAEKQFTEADKILEYLMKK